MMLNIFKLFVVGLLVSGCASTIQSQVQTFSDIEDSIQYRNVFITSKDEKNIETLEWKTYSEILEVELLSKGLFRGADRNDADLIAIFSYGIDEGETTSSTYSIPQYGQTGISSSYTTGSYSSYGTYSGRTINVPSYGVTGYRTGTKVKQLYTRFVRLDFFDAKTNEKKYEASAISKGSCGALSSVVKQIIAASLSYYPQSGTGFIELPYTGNC
tara:strand:+ start:171 stop:812 length:642 start_codon:yes stop_codon:yes gene_type:complete